MAKEYQLTYWNGKGKYQVLYDTNQKMLVPDSGEAETKAGEIVRLVSNIYYERFNNGGSFQSGQRAEQGRELKKLVRFTTPAKDDEPAWDLMVDKCLLEAWADLPNHPEIAKKINKLVLK